MTQWIEKITNAASLEELENLRIDTLGKKGVLTLEFAKMKSVPNEEKKAFAENLNTQKTIITDAIEAKKEILEKEALNKKLEAEKMGANHIMGLRLSTTELGMQGGMVEVFAYGTAVQNNINQSSVKR